MAKLRKRGRFYYLDYSKDGQRIKKSVGTSKATAEIILKDLEVKLAREETGLFLNEISVADFLKKMEVYFDKHHRASTLIRYKNILGHFKTYLGKQCAAKLSTIRPAFFSEYKVYRLGQSKKVHYHIDPADQRPISKNTITMELKILKSVFKLAKQWEHIRENPLEGIEYFKKDKKVPRFYSIEELNIILNASCQPYKDIFSILLATGMRKGELCYLEVKDVDFENRVIKIHNKDAWKPKTGERNIPIYDGVMPILQRLCRERQNGYIFVQEGTELPHTASRWYWYLSKLATRLGLPKCGIHTFRHTFGALAVAEDMNIRKLQEIFGHSDLNMTQIYSNMDKKHLLTGINQIRSIGTIISDSSTSVPNPSHSHSSIKTIPQLIQI